jgi:tripartite-type tricarboxylate transporter receptor subunit TctC
MAVSAGAPAADFYRGKTITMIVGFAPGGGVDTTARVVAHHLGQFIPGRPALMVQNMEGAAGLVAINYLARRVAADGLTIAMPGRTWYLEGAIKGPGVAFDVDRLTFIGSPGWVNSSLYVRTSTGVQNLAELKTSPRRLTFGAVGAATPTAMVPELLAAEGYRVKIIPGYVSSARVLMALEQGEIDGFWTVDDSFAQRHGLIDEQLVHPILQSRPHFPGVPLLSDVIRQSWKPLLTLLEAPETFGLPLVGPAGIPAARTETLRRAFIAMAADPDFRAEAVRTDQPVGSPIGGAELQTMVDELEKAATPDIVAAYRRLESTK